VTTELAEPALTSARFSSLYVEKADFFKLDNLTISRRIDLPASSAFSSLNISLIAQNPLVITSYTGTDPEPSLVDTGAFSNGDGDPNFRDVLSPGIDRRSNYFASRSITLGVNVNF
jgi:iron complex outermembrane receptor protein